MGNTNRTARRIIGITIIGLSVVTATRSSAQNCGVKSGTFQSTVDNGLDCLSPVHICTNGTLSGDLNASYHFEADTLTPDKFNPAVSYFTGHTVMTVTLQNGDAHIYSHDAGRLTFSSPTRADIVNDIGIYDGTDAYDDAAGLLWAVGSIDFVTGLSSGSWSGFLCTP